MELFDLLPQINRIVTQLKVTTKKNLFEQLAEIASIHLSLPQGDLFEAIFTREKLGSTGVGNGVAIPHAKIAGLTKTYGLFITLTEPLDFESLDNHPVDLVFLLIAPDASGADHLKALARVARLFKDHTLCERLRHLTDKTDIYNLLIDDSVAKAA
ncbi:MAG: PTS sugar transporter subunit IIA [Alphaproteobacteria bacterium]|nr:PTS sugar transporter subunit IIA [Alphaproteobacteria bacterium]MDP3532118.1 PTS sugar transporter subunit IIA [Alphaproteobacteria bacterium]